MLLPGSELPCPSSATKYAPGASTTGQVSASALPTRCPVLAYWSDYLSTSCLGDVRYWHTGLTICLQAAKAMSGTGILV
eukprot:575328-Rhodomonas_salina.2